MLLTLEEITQTVEEVPTTRHKSALWTSSLIASKWCGISPNQTTPGRARRPHSEQRGNNLTSISGSTTFSSIERSVPARAGQMGEVVSKTMCLHLRYVQMTSKSLPCISIRWGSSSSLARWSVAISWLARVLKPSTFWVISVNFESGAISCRMEDRENAPSARWASFGFARRALRNQNIVKICECWSRMTPLSRRKW